jgi:hypothetical protein
MATEPLMAKEESGEITVIDEGAAGEILKLGHDFGIF